MWARGRCRISPPRFLAECCKRQLNQGSFVLLYFRLSAFLICTEFVYLYFSVLFCLSVSVKWLSVKTPSEMTCTVSSGALNSTPTNQQLYVHVLAIWNPIAYRLLAVWYYRRAYGAVGGITQSVETPSWPPSSRGLRMPHSRFGLGRLKIVAVHEEQMHRLASIDKMQFSFSFTYVLQWAVLLQASDRHAYGWERLSYDDLTIFLW